MSLIQKLKFFLNKHWRSIYYLVISKSLTVFERNIKICSIDDTINTILKHNCSVSRFGDGEMRLINNESIEFQEASAELQIRLAEVLQSDSKNHLVCLPDIFVSLQQYKQEAAYFWKYHLRKYFFLWLTYSTRKRIYHNSFITRPYIIFKNYRQSGLWFSMLKEIWEDKHVVIIEGFYSRLGMGNDLFNNCKSVGRILCPSLNAFSKYADILAEAKKTAKNKLVLIALGPTATVLAYDLHTLGYQALDIGHIDIEYEWFLLKAHWKVNIPSKHTNEAEAGSILPQEEIVDEKYQSEIVAKLL